MISLIVEGLATAITGFTTAIPTALTGAFDGLFVAGTGAEMALTNLGNGFLALAGISIVVGCVVKVYHVLSGRLRRSM